MSKSQDTRGSCGEGGQEQDSLLQPEYDGGLSFGLGMRHTFSRQLP